jgi:hypothetical protein
MNTYRITDSNTMDYEYRTESLILKLLIINTVQNHCTVFIINSVNVSDSVRYL